MKAVLLLLLLAGLPICAQAMNDPTLPPPAARLLAASSAASAAASAVPPVAQGPQRLQGLRSGQSALIDGQLRRVGERWQSHTLLRIDADAVWLRDPDGQLLRLSLLPPKHPAENRP